MEKHSGKFVLRVPAKLHAKAARAAACKGISLNQVCTEAIDRGLQPVPATELIQKIRDVWKDDCLGVVLFGSVARGEETEESDVDLLIVLKKSTPLKRELYRIWEREVKLVPGPNEVNPHFVHMPESGLADTGSIWFESAIEGIVLFEKDYLVSRFLSQIRKWILDGKVKHSFASGQRYWIKH